MLSGQNVTTARVLSYWKFQELATLMSDSCTKYAPFNASRE